MNFIQYLLYENQLLLLSTIFVTIAIFVVVTITIMNKYKKKKEEIKVTVEQKIKDLQETKKRIKELKEMDIKVMSMKKEAQKVADLKEKKEKIEKEKTFKQQQKEEEEKKKWGIIKKSFNIIKTKSIFSLGGIRDRLVNRMKPERTLLINMELINGMHRQFIVVEKEDGFIYHKKKFIFDNENKYYNIDAKLWSYDYHEEISLPIKRKVPVIDIKKTVESSGLTEVEYSLNPATLERFIVSRIAEGIMKGQQIDEFMRQIRLLLIITMIAAIIHLILFLFKTGMLQQIKLPFG